MKNIRTTHIASYAISEIEMITEKYHDKSFFMKQRSGEAPISCADNYLINRRRFIKYGVISAGVIVVGSSVSPRNAEAISPFLLALIGIFTLATFSWTVSSSEDGRIAFVNDSNAPQNGKVLFSTFPNMMSFREKIPYSQWKNIRDNNTPAFNGNGTYTCDPQSVSIYDVHGLTCPVRTNNATISAETKTDYALVSGVKVL